jgi:predicted amidohydrolase
MKACVVQTHPVFGEIDGNVKKALALIEDTTADLFVFPELFNTGYNFKDEAETRSFSEDVEGPTFKKVAEFTGKKSCYAVYGFAEKADRTYNSAAIVGKGRLIGLYRKTHLFNKEKLLFSPGNLGFPVFDTPAGRIGIRICFDWIYPESARTLALKGAQVIAHPSNLVTPYCPDAMVTRCLENRVFTITSDRVGSEDRFGLNLRFIGNSEIVSPRGDILARLGGTETGIAFADIDPAAADDKKFNEFNDLLADRKPAYYAGG